VFVIDFDLIFYRVLSTFFCLLGHFYIFVEAILLEKYAIHLLKAFPSSLVFRTVSVYTFTISSKWDRLYWIHPHTLHWTMSFLTILTSHFPSSLVFETVSVYTFTILSIWDRLYSIHHRTSHWIMSVCYRFWLEFLQVSFRLLLSFRPFLHIRGSHSDREDGGKIVAMNGSFVLNPFIWFQRWSFR